MNHSQNRVFTSLRQPPGDPVAPRTNRLPLLPSGPDGVHGVLPHGTQQLTKRCKHAIMAEREGFEPSRACTLRAFQARALGQTMRPLQIRRGRLACNLTVTPYQKPNQYSQSVESGQIRGVGESAGQQHRIPAPLAPHPQNPSILKILAQTIFCPSQIQTTPATVRPLGHAIRDSAPQVDNQPAASLAK